MDRLPSGKRLVRTGVFVGEFFDGDHLLTAGTVASCAEASAGL
jgi:hypothetical protein